MQPINIIDWERLSQTMVTSFVFNTLFGADPVDCVRGRLFIFQQDLTYQDLYGSLVFARRYDSRLEFCGTMGNGWIHEWEDFLFAREGKIHAVLPDAHQEIFSLQADGSLINDREGNLGTTLTCLSKFIRTGMQRQEEMAGERSMRMMGVCTGSRNEMCMEG